MQQVKNIHFIGIGGSGMNGIAEVMLKKGYSVSGSDIGENPAISHLRSLGARIIIGHNENNIETADVVVISSAITKDNPEVKAANVKRIPVMPRAQMLGEVMRLYHGIAIAGTHGKTTTTSLIASLLTEAGLDPTYVIGGLLNSSQSNAKLGESKYFVAEADESDASFLYLHPKITIVTNIDADHMQTYNEDFKKLKKTFLDFLHHLPFYGLAIVCIDDETIRKTLPKIARPITTYGFDETADVRAINFRQEGTKCYFDVCRKNQSKDLQTVLNLSGRHNVLNALAAIAVAGECGIGDSVISKVLAKFQGVGRRFQMHGELDFGGKRALVIDDYGHHPAEIAVTLEAVRTAWPEKRLVLAFQPHRYTRTKLLFEDFTKVLSNPDVLLLLDIYPAGEKPIVGINGRALTRSIRQRGKVEPIFVEKIDDLIPELENVLQDGDVLLLQGAGSIGNISGRLRK